MKRITFEQRLLSFATRLSSFKAIKAISNGLGSLLSITLTAAVFALLSGLPFPAYQQFLAQYHLQEIFIFINQCTMGLISIYTTAVISRHYAQLLEVKTEQAVLFALMAYFIVSPAFTAEEVLNFSFTWLGASGLFVAILLPLITTRMYAFFILKGMAIHLPDSVPQGIANAFASIVPALTIATLAGIIKLGFNFTSYGSIHQFMFDLVQAPLSNVGGSFAGILISVITIHILWLLGIHGGMVVTAIMNPIFMALDSANLVAFGSGAPLPNYGGNSFILVYAAIGGAGCTLALNALMLWKARSKQYKALGKLAIAPSIFGIGEPMIYGTPIMLNPLLCLPFLLCPIINTILAYGCTYLTILPRLNGAGMTIFVLNGFLNGSWKIAAFIIVLFIIDILIYYPFFQLLDRKSYEQEKATTSSTKI